MEEYHSDFTTLREAVTDGNLNMIKHLISRGISVNAVDDEHWTALMIAASTGNNDVLNLLIDLGADLNMGNIRGETALTCAIKARQTQPVLILLGAGADSTIRDENGDDALLCATRLNAIDIVRNLLRSGVNINCLNDDGDSCLGLAYKAGKSEMVITFLEFGMLDNIIDHHGNSLLITAVRLGDIEMLHILVHFKANLNFQNDNKFTALITAVQNKHHDVAQVLVKAGAQLDITNKYGDTALTVASRDGNLLTVSFLLDSGANIEEGGTMKISPLMHAAFYCQLDVVSELLQRGANVNAKNIDGESALATFCHKPACDLIHATCKILVEHGADVNLEDVNNLRPLVKAIVNNKSDFAQILISSGADVEFAVCIARFRGKETPLIMATRLKRVNVVRRLLEYNAHVNATNRRGSTALHLATKNEELTSLLIQAGADLNSTDGDGLTPLMIASGANSAGVVNHLIQAGACVNLKHYASDRSALYYATTQKNNGIVEILLQAGAELRYELHIAIKRGATDVVRTMVMNGALPTCQNTNHEKSKGSNSSKTPFSNAVICGEISIALYLESIWFFNTLDMYEIPQTTSLQKSLKDRNKLSETINFVNHLSREPRRLLIISFVAVSSAVGFHSGRAHRVNELNLPNAFKRRLLYQDKDARLPVGEWRTFNGASE